LGQAFELANDEIEAVVIDPVEPSSTPVRIFPEQWRTSFPPATGSTRALGYLEQRGVTAEQVVQLDFRYDTERDAVVLPIRAYDGSLVGLHGRRLTPGPSPKYHAYKYNGEWNKLPWVGEHTVDPDQTLVLVESIFDYTQVQAVYPNVLAALSAGFSREKLRRLSGCLDCVTLFDWGTGGDTARSAIDKALADMARVHLVPPAAYGDPGDMPRTALADLLQPHVVLSS